MVNPWTTSKQHLNYLGIIDPVLAFLSFSYLEFNIRTVTVAKAILKWRRRKLKWRRVLAELHNDK